MLARLGGEGFDAGGLAWLVIVLAWSAVGALIVSRQPRNAIGWLLCGVAIFGGLAGVASGLAELFLAGRLPRAIGEPAAWLSNWAFIPLVFVPVTFVLLLFPAGRLLSRRWRPALWAAAVGIPAFIVSEGLDPGPLADYESIVNPYGIDESHAETFSIGLAFVLGSVLASAASLLVRLRRATGAERQQIKWLVYTGCVVGAAVLAGFVLGGVGFEDVADAIVLAGLLLLPLGFGVAMLRYRLYDIDLVIRRTLAYGVASAGLAGLYFGIVIALQQVFSSFAGGSDLAIAGSTLAVAALFGPVRRRIQTVVDRRFYRRRYDAQRTLEGFAARLRDEIELDSLNAELTTVVRDTMRPAHVSLWLRSPPS